MNYKAEIHFDNNKEIDGTPRKILDSSLAHKYGFFTKLNFLEGLDLTLKDFLNKERI